MNRNEWVEAATKIAEPLLTKLANGQEFDIAGDPKRYVCSPFEGLARTLAGIAPWLSTDASTKSLRLLSQNAIWKFFKGNPKVTKQSIIDFAYFTVAVRAYPALYEDQSPECKERINAFHRQVLKEQPLTNNWLLAMAMNELFPYGHLPDMTRVEYALRQHAQWYKGDSIYGDGPDHQQDYYNSLVVHPFLYTLLEFAADGGAEFANEDFAIEFQDEHFRRLHRYAHILERQISPEGTYPVVGRSATYRMGVFYALGFAVTKSLWVPGARDAMSRVLARFMNHGYIFRPDGLLHVGFMRGEQLELAEPYVSTGSVYACMLFFTPLYFSDAHTFWTSDTKATQARIWSGEEIPIDKSIGDPLK